jgi:hypothetical protein
LPSPCSVDRISFSFNNAKSLCATALQADRPARTLQAR